MPPGHSYLLGTGKPYPKTWNRAFVTLRLASSARMPVLGFADGFFPHDCGSSCDVAELLNRPIYLQMLRDFELDWFIPYIERMAHGESFTVDEIQSIFYQQTGRQMEAASATGHFKFMERPNEFDIV